jgi:hypothetical protein
VTLETVPGPAAFMLEVVDTTVDDASTSPFVIEISCGIEARPFLEVDRLERERKLIASVVDLSIDIPCGELVCRRDCERDDLTKLPLQRLLELVSLGAFVDPAAPTAAPTTDASFKASFEGNEAVDFAFDDAFVFAFDDVLKLDGVVLALGDGGDLAFADAANDTDFVFDDADDFVVDTTDIVDFFFDCADTFEDTDVVDFIFGDATSFV